MTVTLKMRRDPEIAILSRVDHMLSNGPLLLVAFDAAGKRGKVYYMGDIEEIKLEEEDL